MQSKSNLTMLGAAFLLLFVTQACHAQLMCYICDDCAKTTVDTPQQLCDADFFATGTTLPSVQTTPEDPTTQPTTEVSIMPSSTTTTEAPMSSSSSSTSTTEMSTTIENVSTSDESTEAPIPTPPTVGLPQTTTHMPTPPNQGTVIVPVGDFFVNSSSSNSSSNLNATAMMTTTPMPAPTTKTYLNSSELRVRQLRSVVDTSVTYHCYRVLKNDNGTVSTSRGCSRVTTDEGVCSQLQMANDASPSSNITKCFACSTKLCNSSSSLGISMMALLVGVVAALLQRN